MRTSGGVAVRVGVKDQPALDLGRQRGQPLQLCAFEELRTVVLTFHLHKHLNTIPIILVD
jgi:hypothetical protein